MLSLGLGESKASMPTRMNLENYFRRATPMEDEDAEVLGLPKLKDLDDMRLRE